MCVYSLFPVPPEWTGLITVEVIPVLSYGKKNIQQAAGESDCGLQHVKPPRRPSSCKSIQTCQYFIPCRAA